MSIDDEGGYAVVAHELLEDGTLYQSALDRRPPLLFWIYEAIFWIVGKYNWLPFHIVAVAWIVLTMAGLYAIGKRLFSREAGLAAALLYSVCTTSATWENLAFNGEIMMNLPIVWALYIALKPSTSSKRWELVAAGVLLACAFLIKQPATIAAVPVGVYLLLPSYRSHRQLQVRDSIVQVMLLTASYFLTLGVVIAILHWQGILGDAYYWTIGDHDVPHGLTDPVFWKRGIRETLGTVAVWHPLIALCAASFMS